MSKNDREDILRKVRALFRVSKEDSGAFQGEMENASKLMQKFMDEFNITIEEVALSDNEKEEQDNFTSVKADIGFGRMKIWHWYLARAISNITGCRNYAHSNMGHSARDPKGHRRKIQSPAFFGRPEQAQLSAELFAVWVVLIDDMAKIRVTEYIEELMAEPDVRMMMEAQNVKQARHLKNMGEHHPNIFRDSWLLGVIMGVLEAIEEREKERSKEMTTALLVINDRVDEAYSDYSKSFLTQNVRSSKGEINYGALTDGQQVGRGLNLDTVNAPKISRGG